MFVTCYEKDLALALYKVLKELCLNTPYINTYSVWGNDNHILFLLNSLLTEGSYIVLLMKIKYKQLSTNHIVAIYKYIYNWFTYGLT